MIGNGVKETTATTGVGALTLTAVTGFPRFADVFAVNDLAYYAIQDGNNWEWGLGTVGAGNTLARTRVLATYSAGVYESAAPTALNLAAGTKTVICTPPAQGVAPARHAVDTYWNMQYSAHLATYNGLGSGSGTMIANVLYLVPYLALVAQKITALKFYVATAAAAGKKARIGLYRVGSNGKVSSLILESTDILVDTTGWKTYSLPSAKLLAPGWYATAFVTDGTPAVRGTVAVHGASFLFYDSTTQAQLLAVNPFIGAWTALPANAPAYSNSDAVASPSNIPAIYVEVG